MTLLPFLELLLFPHLLLAPRRSHPMSYFARVVSRLIKAIPHPTTGGTLSRQSRCSWGAPVIAAVGSPLHHYPPPVLRTASPVIANPHFLRGVPPTPCTLTGEAIRHQHTQLSRETYETKSHRPLQGIPFHPSPAFSPTPRREGEGSPTDLTSYKDKEKRTRRMWQTTPQPANKHQVKCPRVTSCPFTGSRYKFSSKSNRTSHPKVQKAHPIPIPLFLILIRLSGTNI